MSRLPRQLPNQRLGNARTAALSFARKASGDVMRDLLKTAIALGALLAGTLTALAQNNPAVGYWTSILMARANDPYVSYEVQLSPDGQYAERMIVNPGGVALYSGTWSYEPQSSMLTYTITRWDPITIPPPAANHAVTVRVEFADGGYTMVMDQPGGVPLKFTKQR